MSEDETFNVSYCFLQLRPGENLLLVGNLEELGTWDYRKAPSFTWTASHVWQLSIVLPVNKPAEFKIVQAHSSHPGALQWQVWPFFISYLVIMHIS